MRLRLLFCLSIASLTSGCIGADRVGSRVLDDAVPANAPADKPPTEAPPTVTFPNAPITSPIQKFETLLQEIHSYVEPLIAQTPQQRVESLRFSGITSPLRYFQELVTIYGKKFEKLDPLDEEAKKLENFISHLVDRESFLSSAQASGNAEAIAKAQSDLDTINKEFLAYVTTSAWFAAENSYVDQIRAAAAPLATMSIEEDRNIVLKRIARKLKKQSEKVYDFTQVEEGIHEYRRDARRLDYLNFAAASIIRNDRQGQCPMLTTEQWNALSEEARKNPVPTVVPEPTPAPTTDYYCHVSNCLTNELSSISQNLAFIKTQAAALLAQGKPAPPELIDQARQLHDKSAMAFTNMFLWSQIKSCMTPGAGSGNDD